MCRMGRRGDGEPEDAALQTCSRPNGGPTLFLDILKSLSTIERVMDSLSFHTSAASLSSIVEIAIIISI